MGKTTKCEGGVSNVRRNIGYVDNGCPLRNDCYRFTTPADPVTQDFLAGVPYNPDTGKCEYYLSNLFKK